MLGSIRSLKNSSVVVFLLMVFVSGQVSLLQADEYITCESKNDRRSYCNVSGIRDSNIELDRKLSKSPCIAEQTWGTDSRGIWVDGGCRAEFRVTRREDRVHSQRLEQGVFRGGCLPGSSMAYRS